MVDDSAGGPVFARQVVPAAASGPVKTHTVYLNHLGVTLRPGPNNSQANTSTIVPRTMQVPGWNASAADWTATVACMKELWSRFDVTVTDVDPGATPHIEAVFTRSPSDVGLAANYGGVSPFATDCSVIESSIVFAFTANLASQPRAICEVMAQEIAHSYGLDHELLASDPMTYLPYSGARAFQDHDAACGESVARPCGIAGSTCRPSQNSVQLLLARVGASGRNHQAPTVAIMAPAEASTVPAGFSITASASDDIAVASVAFYLDGALVATRSAPPYQLATSDAIAGGAHTIVVEATDADGNVATAQRDIVVASDAPDPVALGCSAGGQPPLALAALVLAAALCRIRPRRASRPARCRSSAAARSAADRRSGQSRDR